MATFKHFKMLKINFLELYVFILHEINFVCSPISGERFEEEYRERLMINYVQKFKYSKINKYHDQEKGQDICNDSTRSIDSSRKSIDFWNVVLRPIELFKLIKRFHQTGNRFVFFFLLHNLFCVHLAMKTIIHACFIEDETMVQYFRDIHYPHLAGDCKNLKLYNNVFLVLSVSVMIVRLRSSYILIKQSILNAHNYKELCISQITLADLTWWNFTLDEWKELFVLLFKHRQEIKNDIKVRNEHYKFDQNIQKQVPYLCQLDLMYHINVADFNECYRLSTNLSSKLNVRKKKYSNWHCADGSPRLSLNIVGLWTIIFLLVCLFNFILINATILGVIYLDIESYLPDNNHSIHEIYSKLYEYYVMDINNTIRVVELWLLILLQLPQHFDASFASLNILVMIDRTQKLIKSFDDDSKFCHNKVRFDSIKQIHLSKNKHTPSTNTMPIKLDQSMSSEPIRSKQRLVVKPLERSELNRRLKHNVRLAGLMYLEFVDIKRAYTSLFTILIIGNGICLSYAISLFFKLDSLAECSALSVIILSSILPIIGAMLVCASVEKTVSLSEVKSIANYQ